MSSHSSGCYVIDNEYNVVNVNETAAGLYPQLKVGKKCYKCLMGLDEPCPPCPVAGGVKGPCTYTDPIRNITEIVDAVDIDIPAHGPCHMLIFSTVENEANFAATLPTSAEELKNLALIKGLTSDYYDVFSVNTNDKKIIVYRLNGKSLDPDSIYNKDMYYEPEIENYIQKYVHPDDQEMMRRACTLSEIRAALSVSESMVLHYRVLLNGEIHYYFRKFVRIGDADSFENFIIGIACEDEAVENRERQIALQKTLRKVELNTATGLLTKEAFFVYGQKLLNDFADTCFDFAFLKIENLDSIGHQYGTIMRNQVLQEVGEALRGYMDEKTCTAYFGDGVFACFVESQETEVFQQIIDTFESQVREKSKIRNSIFKWSIYKHISRTIPIEELYSRVAYFLNMIRASIPKDYFEIDQAMLEKVDWDISVQRNFQNALDDGEFVVWYQPKYSVHTKEIVGAEALVRWITPGGEMVPPNKFIPVLENTGLIDRLDEEVFRQVCILQKKCKDQNLPQLPISVNLSRASIFTKDIPQIYAEIAHFYGVDSSLIPIEITESAAVRASMIGEFAKQLIHHGFSLHMDDFGAGYSSLASLQTLPFECIKIDKSLVDFIGEQNGENLLKHTIAFAKESGLSVTAEGVERMEQYMFLKIAGCDVIQGYYFSRPVNEDTFWSMLDHTTAK